MPDDIAAPIGDAAPALSAYERLKDRFARRADVSNAAGILHWDRAVMMPGGAAEGRGDQLATLSGIAHEMLTAPEVSDWLDEAEAAFDAADEDAFDPWDRANLSEMRRAHTHASALPQRLVEAMTRAASRTEMIWREARKQASFAMLEPGLGDVLTLTREAAAAKAEALNTSPYEALLDQYDPGMTTAVIDDLFADLEAFLPDFLERVMAYQTSLPPLPELAERSYPIEAQAALARDVMAAIGFDFGAGRLDVSTHPFCGGASGDIRITTRYEEGDFTRALMGVLHETGHAMYEAGLPDDWRRQPVGSSRGMTLHESQSLLMEMQACRSDAFMTYLEGAIANHLGAAAQGWDVQRLKRLYQNVEPGFIRVDADEVTYPAHVILRYRLETAMIAGDLDVVDLPGAWNEGMRDLLGIVPPDDAQGCLQDIHWPDGAFGYFPTYTLGALAGAQPFQAARRALPDSEARIAEGDFAPLMGWLRTHVHGKASSMGTAGIIEAATGSSFGTEAFKAHLQDRYLP